MNSPPDPSEAVPSQWSARHRLDLLSADEAAKVLHVSPKSLARWRSEGIGPRFTRAGRKPLYRSADLADWLDRHLADSTSAKREGTR